MLESSDTLLLDGSWRLADAAGGPEIAFLVPGEVHSTLIDAGLAPDLHVGENETALLPIATRTWIAIRDFTVPPDRLDGRTAILDLDRLDGIAEVRLDGRLLGLVDGPFRRRRFPLPHLAAGDHRLELTFRPVAEEAAARAARLPFPVPWSQSNNRIPHLNTVRQPQCRGGWDWGPVMMAIGLGEAPVLRFCRDVRIEAVTLTQVHVGARVTVAAEIALAGRPDASAPVELTVAGLTTAGEVRIGPDGTARLRLTVDLDDPPLWWPVGLGTQPLHEVVVAVPGDRVERRIGLRTAEVIAEPDAIGTSMVVRINGRDVFCRGANWVPADALPARATPERLAALIEAALAANMNMLRVWGGGAYESDAFYDLCDQRGLMIWQDMMFACSQYPSTPEFLTEVDREVRFQVARLSGRPSIVLWCGDNEVIGSLGWYEISRANRDRYLVNYDRLNRTIETAVRATDPDRRFWPSSPSRGGLDYGDAWHDDSAGDMHWWTVWHENAPFEKSLTVTPRFCSEFGFQAFPTLPTIAGFAEPADFNPTAPVIEFHQRDPVGNARIIETMARHFRMPSTFAGFVFLSQLQQALAIETAVAAWRGEKPRCMGTLYWQLNDVWPAVSWSSLDHRLGWKTLHHHARRFYAPEALLARRDGDRLRVRAVADGPAPVELEARLMRVRLDGTLLDECRATIAVPLDRAVEVFDVAAPDDRETFFVVDGRRAGAGDWEPPMRSVVLLEAPKRLALRRPDVRVTPTETDGVFQLETDRPAFWVRLEAPDYAGVFDDGSFLALPGETRRLAFRAPAGAPMPETPDLRLAHLASVEGCVRM